MPESAASQIPSVPEVTEALSTDSPRKGFRQLDERRVYVYATPLSRNDRPAGALVVFLDASHLADAEWALWQQNAIRFARSRPAPLGHHRPPGAGVGGATHGPHGGVDQVAQDRTSRAAA